MNPRGWPPRYALWEGRGPMRRFSAVTWLRGLPGLAQRFSREVPGEYWVADVDGEERIGVISCTCGATPKARENRLTPCEGEGCGRVFLLLGESMRVARP